MHNRHIEQINSGSVDTRECLTDKYMVDYAHRNYAPRKIPHTFGPLDNKGIPLFEPRHIRLQGPPVYHPIVIIQYALAHYDLWVNGDKSSEEIFFNCASWLEENAVPDKKNRFLVWEYPFPLQDLGVPPRWISGMAQGQGLSVLVRSLQKTGSKQTLECAQNVAKSFQYSLYEGGVTSYFPSGNQFIEEVAHPPVLQILNGCLYALYGLHEYLTVIPNSSMEPTLMATIMGVEEKLPEFDTGWWSRYSLGMRWHLASVGYHITHIHQLRCLANCLNRPRFGFYANKWDKAYSSKTNRGRYQVEQLFQRCANKVCTLLDLDNIKYNASAKIVG